MNDQASLFKFLHIHAEARNRLMGNTLVMIDLHYC